MSRPVILLTDFGAEGHYHGVMKAVIATRAPKAVCIDLGHGIQPGAVREASYVLEASLDHLPPRSLVVVVVDPGVGSSREILVHEHEGRILIAPDNGLLTPWLEAGRGTRRLIAAAVAPDPSRISKTFHGRDLFAPAAAELARGVALEELSEAHPKPLITPEYHARREGDSLVGRIVHVDRFGNLISNIRGEELPSPEALEVAVATQRLPLSTTFSDVAPGLLVAYVGSSGHLEVAVRDGNAGERLGLGLGDEFRAVTKPR